ncbi:hypothetical protein [Vitiosangium sp. GDMCC 1.1324]|uniref:hypothetical protein n=1 Tax=Vitiosangium sp. (strain GDMCC 1.1324) TaxID=2138576 RepID=UPI00130DFF81|nr:hypothetical protein [Vitiosangium sp. GDMCC 1.1324]
MSTWLAGGAGSDLPRARACGALRVVTVGDTALESLLRAAGALVVLRTLAMRGPLPP